MDIVVLPDNISSHELVPDLGGPDFDNQGFRGYDRRRGWNSVALRRGELSKAREDWSEYGQIELRDNTLGADPATREWLIASVFGPFIQTWIIFGILQEALRRPVWRSEVSRIKTTVINPGGTSAATKVLVVRHLFDEFIGNIPAIRADQGWASNLAEALREAAFTLGAIDRAWQSLGDHIVPLPAYLGLTVLVQSLIYYGAAFCSPHFGTFFPNLGCILLEDRLTNDHGWCPSLVRRLADLGIEALLYAGVNVGLGKGQAHDKCNTKTCVGSNVERGTYRTQHVSKYCSCWGNSCDHRRPECPCKHIAMPESAMTEAFREGGYPLISLDWEKLKVVRYEPGTKYIAISHVWSDGRGNEVGNALPLCQLKSIHLYVLTQAIDRNALFWIDTMCVPTKEPLRNTAIMRMAQVYSAATQVLVLSSEFLARSLPSTPDEALFTIFCSKWMTRLWTMQEAALAKDIVFQFADQSIRYAALDDSMSEASVNLCGPSRVMGWQVYNAITSVVRMKRQNWTPDDFWRALQYRSTSRLSDAAICGSILLESDLGQVLSAPDDRKVQTFWSCQRYVAAGVLWAEGPRLTQDGFRWAPDVLVNRDSMVVPRYNSQTPTAEIDGGLVVQGIESIDLGRFALPTRDLGGIRFSLRHSSVRYMITNDLDTDIPTWAELESLWTEKGVLLLPELPVPSTHVRAALVSLLDDGGRDVNLTSRGTGIIISARYIAAVWVGVDEGEVQSTIFDADLPIEERAMDPTHGGVDIMGAHRLDTSQRWRIL